MCTAWAGITTEPCKKCRRSGGTDPQSMDIKMKKYLLLAVLVLQGCATIIDGKQQTVSFSSNPDGATVTLNGMQIGKTPTTIPIPRRSGVQVLKFSKEGFKDSEIPINAEINNWFWGNILLGGLYGSTTDGFTGAAYEYKPGSFMVTLQPLTGSGMPAPMSLNENQKVVNFIVMSYNQLMAELNGKSGQYLASLFEIAVIPDAEREEARKKLKALADVYSVIPEYAEKSAEILIKKKS